MDNTNENTVSLAEKTFADVAKLPAAPFDLDPNVYMSELEEFSISEDQKIELLQTLWSIMRSMVELGFDPKICERILLDSNESPVADSGNI